MPSNPCVDKETLAERLSEARLLYAAATRELEAMTGKTAEFDVAYEHAENAKTLYEAARIQHEAHIKEHGC